MAKKNWNAFGTFTDQKAIVEFCEGPSAHELEGGLFHGKKLMFRHREQTGYQFPFELTAASLEGSEGWWHIRGKFQFVGSGPYHWMSGKMFFADINVRRRTGRFQLLD